MNQSSAAYQESDSVQSSPLDMRLGALMVRAGTLSHSEAEKVGSLLPQEGLRFGDLAIKLKLVKPEDVEAALTTQRSYAEFPVQQVMQRQDVMAALDPAGCNIDQLRAIRGQLQLGWFTQHKTLLLSGPSGGEGTSMITAGLGCIFADLGWRTLLIDANLRAPRQHKLFGLTNQLGLSTILANSPGALHPQRVSHVASLSVLVAGPTSSNPAELISRDTFKHILAEGAARYDVVLVDGPCGASPEFQVLAAHIGGLMIIAQKGTTHLAAVRELKDRVQRVGAQVVGAVLNDY
jgi:receptor protein-tyrosine kinase